METRPQMSFAGIDHAEFIAVGTGQAMIPTAPLSVMEGRSGYHN